MWKKAADSPLFHGDTFNSPYSKEPTEGVDGWYKDENGKWQ